MNSSKYSLANLFDQLKDVSDSNYFSTTYIMKMLRLDRNDIRKEKIKKIFKEE